MSEDNQWTTITVPESVKQELDESRGGIAWGNYLEQLHRDYSPIDSNEVASSITAELNVDASDAKDEINDLKALVEATKGEVEVLEDSLTIELEATERSKIAREVAEELR